MALELFPVENIFLRYCVMNLAKNVFLKLIVYQIVIYAQITKGSKISRMHIFQSPDLNLEEPCIGAGGVWRDLRRRPPLAEALSEVGDALEEVGAGAPCAQRFSLLRRFRCRPRGNTKLKL